MIENQLIDPAEKTALQNKSTHSALKRWTVKGRQREMHFPPHHFRSHCASSPFPPLPHNVLNLSEAFSYDTSKLKSSAKCQDDEMTTNTEAIK